MASTDWPDAAAAASMASCAFSEIPKARFAAACCPSSSDVTPNWSRRAVMLPRLPSYADTSCISCSAESAERSVVETPSCESDVAKPSTVWPLPSSAAASPSVETTNADRSTDDEPSSAPSSSMRFS